MTTRVLRNYDAQETARMRRLQGTPLASFKSRLAAFVIDFFACFAVFAAAVVLGGRAAEKLGLVSPDANINLKFDLEHWYSLLFLVVYFGLATYWGRGQTPGKRLLKIRVVSLVHEHLTLWHCTERALGYGASALEFGFGFLQYFTHVNRRTVHDRIAETIVVRDPSAARDASTAAPKRAPDRAAS
jgi:uncharacterized RDD family membrane protein YckC